VYYRFDYRDKLPQVADICRRYGVRELLLFGSALGPNFTATSDLDFVVDFRPDARIGLVAFIHLKFDLQTLFGRKVDLVPKPGIKPNLRDGILRSAEPVYAA
jgi:predicted nucleotidyltransferase